MDRAAAEAALVKLARQFQGSWQKARARSFWGAVTFETENTSYRFVDGILAGRAPRSRTGFPVWELPEALRGAQLLGFLHEERGCWSVSSRWREGAFAVTTSLTGELTMTSPTIDFDQHEPTIPTVRTIAAPLRRSA